MLKRNVFKRIRYGAILKQAAGAVWHALFTLLLVVPSHASGNSGITYHGRVLRPDGGPLEGKTVEFKLQVRSPGPEGCIMYEELQVIDMRSSNGVFSLTINDGSGTRLDSGAYPFTQVFSNRGTFNFSSCEIGNTYSPNSGDGREFRISFRSENMASWEAVGPQKLNFAPFSFEALRVGGFSPQHLLRVDDSVVSANQSPLNSSQFSNLMALIDGSSTQYVVASGGTGAKLPSVAGTPTGAVAGSLWFDTATGQLGYFDGATSKVLSTGAGSGTVTSVTAGAGLSGGTITNSGTIALAPSGVSAGTYQSLTVDTYGRVTAGAALTAAEIPLLDWSKISSGKPTSIAGYGITDAVANAGGAPSMQEGLDAGKPAASTVGRLYVATDSFKWYRDNGTSWDLLSPVSSGTVSSVTAGTGLTGGTITSTGTIALATSGVGAGTYQSVTVDTYGRVTSGAALVAAEIPSLDTSKITSGTLPVTNGGTGTTTGSISGTGALTFAAGGTNQDVTLTPSGTGKTILGGNVGIGTTAPAYKLDLIQGPGANTFRLGSDTTNYMYLDSGGTETHVYSQGARPFKLGTNGNVNQLVLDSTGNVGIGTTTPASALHVATGVSGGTSASGTVTFESSSAVYLQLLNPSALTSQIRFGSEVNNGAGLVTYAHPTNKMSFYTDGSQRMFIDGLGNVGIGTTSFDSQYRLAVTSTDATQSGLRVSSDAGGDVSTFSRLMGFTDRAFSTQYATFVASSDRFALRGNRVVEVSANGAAVLLAPISGNIGIGTTTPEVSLDVGARTDAIKVAGGTTVQRPTGANGLIRYNTDNNKLEAYINGGWQDLAAAGTGGSYLSSSGGTLSGALTISSGGASITGGVNNNSGGITNAGSITGVGANITGSGALTVAAGGAAQNLTLSSSTTGSVNLGSGNGTSFSVLDGGVSTVNYVTVKGASTGLSPVIGVAGADANINLTLTPKGTGNTIFSSGNVGVGTTSPNWKLQVAGGASSVRSTTTDFVSGTTGSSLGIFHGAGTGNTYSAIQAGTVGASTTGNLALNPNGGNVGIGTTAPNASFHLANKTSLNTAIFGEDALGTVGSGVNRANVHIASSNANSNLIIGQSATAYLRLDWLYNATESSAIGRLITVGAVPLTLGSNAAERMRIDSAGNVGIGTTSPIGQLHVTPVGQANITNSAYSAVYENYLFGAITTGTGKTYSGLHIQAPTSALLNLWSSQGSGNAIKFDSAARSTTDENVASVAIITGDSTTNDSTAGGLLRFSTRTTSGSIAERMRIDSNGNIGVGTTSPGARLSFGGFGPGIGASTLRLYESGTDAYGFGISGGTLNIHSGISSATVFSQGAIGSEVERMRIANGGNVGVGTTAPTAALHLKSGNAAASSAPLKFTSSAGSLLSTAEDGAMEYDGTNYYLTVGSTRSLISLGGGASSFTTVGVGTGSAAAPSLTFSGDTDTGFYDSSSNNTISVATGGAKIFDFSSAGLISPTTGGAVVTSANGTAASPTFGFAGDAGLGWFRPSASTLAAATAGTERVRIDSSGNVGIGLTNPAVSLHIQASTDPEFNIGTSGGVARARLGVPTTAGNISLGSLANSVVLANESGALHFATATTTPSSVAMTIATSGNVGIGTTTPGERLDVAGTLRSEVYKLGDTVAEKSFLATFADSVPNQKIQIYFPASTRFQGLYEFSLATGYEYASCSGAVKKTFGGYGGSTGFLYNLNTTVSFITGYTRNCFTISDPIWDAGNLRWYVVIANLLSAQNSISVIVRSHAITNSSAARADQLQASAIYTTDTTVFPKLNISFTSNVGIGTTSPGTLPGYSTLSAARYLETSGDASASATATGVVMLTNNRDTPTVGDLLGGVMFASKNDASGANNFSIVQVNSEGSGGANGFGHAMRFLVKGDNNTNAERMRISSAGKVGIGTASPTARLSIYHNEDPGVTDSALNIVTPGVANGASVDQFGIKINSVSYNNSTAMYGIYSKAFQNTGGVSYGVFGETGGSASSSTYGIYGKGNQINTNGGGISYGVFGTVVSAGANTNGRTYAGYFDNQATTGNTSVGLYVNSVGGALNNYSALFMGGNVGIGTTAPGYKLHVLGSGGSTVAHFSDGTQSCSITPSTAGNISCSSDQRLKKDITSFSDVTSLENILQLNTVTYHWNTGDERLHTGYIAQQVEKVAPEFVVTGNDGMKQVSYVGFIPWITGAIKALYAKLIGHDAAFAEQRSRIETLENQNAVLKEENAALKTQQELQAKDIAVIKKKLGM